MRLLKYLMVEVELSPFFKDTELDIPCFMGLIRYHTSDVGGGHTCVEDSYDCAPTIISYAAVLTCH